MKYRLSLIALLIASAGVLAQEGAYRGPAQEGGYPGPKIEKLDRVPAEIPKDLEWWGTAKRPQLADYRKKVLVLIFWTNDDLSSNKNLIYYNKWKKAYEEKGLALLSVHLPPKAVEPSEAVKKMMPPAARAELVDRAAKLDQSAREKAKSFRELFPTVFAKDDSYLEELGGKKKLEFSPGAGRSTIQAREAPVVPTLFLIDRKGKLRYRVQDVIAFDFRKSYEPQVVEKIEALLREPKE